MSWQDRLREEATALDEKRGRLRHFLGALPVAVSAEDLTLLQVQLGLMDAYSIVLHQRIRRIEP